MEAAEDKFKSSILNSSVLEKGSPLVFFPCRRLVLRTLMTKSQTSRLHPDRSEVIDRMTRNFPHHGKSTAAKHGPPGIRASAMVDKKAEETGNFSRAALTSDARETPLEVVMFTPLRGRILLLMKNVPVSGLP
ncbi:hypothetical protein AGABI2DRAFT_114928 [Agaricus bisporus var. bisporus H97]|uniref:hypothetical protein n=1 Tax=Agaricus bisporus var. bisporus (strain H97 / ATCC MYA-4626 / FGSC 10389) TaxID=936046 RepID=UPI00029F71EF|nr:hypothetical protein AGABI2DRAFT_114928 [Agaricus bisporus var. bisporus H97]EKV49859.1 hypothetical protein AGABI2DRAFT_114928 [Agaricus bisporus var. bisporus H97]